MFRFPPRRFERSLGGAFCVASAALRWRQRRSVKNWKTPLMKNMSRRSPFEGGIGFSELNLGEKLMDRRTRIFEEGTGKRENGTFFRNYWFLYGMRKICLATKVEEIDSTEWERKTKKKFSAFDKRSFIRFETEGVDSHEGWENAPSFIIVSSREIAEKRLGTRTRFERLGKTVAA